MIERYYFDWLRETRGIDLLSLDVSRPWDKIDLETPYFFYRCFNVVNECLYVGACENPVLEVFMHKKESFWFPLVANMYVYNCECKTEALALVDVGVRLENPQYIKRVRDFTGVKEFKKCPVCDKALDPAWAGAQRVYCGDKCQEAARYDRNKEYHKKRYKEQRNQWEKSSVGKKAGMSFTEWKKLPKEWRDG